MTTEEFNEFMERPVEEVIEETVQELTEAGYGEELEFMSFPEISDKVNTDYGFKKRKH